MMRYLLTCFEGIEPEVAADALELDARRAEPLEGGVLVEADAAFAYRANLAHPTATRVHVVLAQGEVHDLGDARRLCDEVAWEDVFDLERTFAADCVRVGKHDFGSMDLERVLGDAVTARFRTVTGGARPPVDLAAPEVTVGAHLRDARMVVTLDTTGRPLDKRDWRVALHPASLNASLASAMVRLSGWRDGLLLDPLCGSGTIPIEADLRARRVAPNLAREDWAFARLPAFDAEAFARERRGLAQRVPADGAPVLGNERDPERLAAARANAEAARASAGVAWREGDFEAMARPEGLAAVVANPPWGLRLSSRTASGRILAKLQARLVAWAREAPLAAVLLMDARCGGAADGRLEPADARAVRYGDVRCRLVRYELP